MAKMDRGDKNRPRPSVEEEAAEWFIRAKDEKLRRSDRRALACWNSESPRNINEALGMQQLFGLLRRAKLQKEPGDDDTLLNLVELPQSKPATLPAVPPTVPKRPPGMRMRPWKLAAACALVLAVGLAAIVKIAGPDERIETMAGEWHTQVLEDGSTVRLGPRTRLQVKFSMRRRFIHLSRGEAMFKVAKDAARPFIVDADIAGVRAVGTQFAVSRRDREVRVTVAEGQVAVSRSVRGVLTNRLIGHRAPADHPAAPSATREAEYAAGQPGGASPTSESATSVLVSTGEQVITSATHIQAVHAVNIERELAWVQERLIFENTPIGDAVDEFNRRNRVQIDVPDRAIAAHPVGGTFDAADPLSFVNFVTRMMPVTVVHDRPNVLLLARAAAEGGEPPPRQVDTL